MIIELENIMKGQVWNKPKLPEMLQFEKETIYKAIWGNKITGHFEHWLFEKGLKNSNFSEDTLELKMLMLQFKKETNKDIVWHGQLTKSFKYWLKYKDRLICYDPDCPKFGQEFKSKQSLSTHIQWHDKERKRMSSGENHPRGMLGKHHTPETKKKMSESKKGDKCYWYGKTRSDELKKKQSKAMIKLWQNDEYREKRSEGYRKRKMEQNLEVII